jgi:hypothetical protein
MRRLPFLFLLLVAAHPPGHGGFHQHHQRMSAWHMGSHDGSSPRDFGRTLAPGGRITPSARDRIEVQEVHRLNSFELGHGSRIGIGFVGGRNLGLRLKSPF